MAEIPDDLTHYMQKCSELKAALEQAEQRNERIRVAAGYETEGEDGRLSEIRSLVRAESPPVEAEDEGTK